MISSLKQIHFFIKQSYRANIPCFHSITKFPKEYRYIHAVSFANFSWQVKNFIALSNSYSRFIKNSRFYKKKLSISFDDAYLDILEEAIPYLLSNNIPATIFINSTTLNGSLLWRDKLRLIIDEGLLDELVKTCPKSYNFTYENIYFKSKTLEFSSLEMDRLISQFIKTKSIGYKKRLYMNANELTEVSESGLITLGNHTRNHYLLSSLTNKEQEEEIVGGHKDLEKKGLRVSNVFAVPFGGYNSINAYSLTILEKLGYSSILLTNNGQRVDRAKLPAPTKLEIRNRFLPKNR